MANFLVRIDGFLRKKSVKYGVPFLLVVLGGSFGLQQFSQLRYDFSRVSPVVQEAKRNKIEMKKTGEVNIETEYEKIQKLDIDNWEQVRGPRPWEEDQPKP